MPRLAFFICTKLAVVRGAACRITLLHYEEAIFLASSNHRDSRRG